MLQNSFYYALICHMRLSKIWATIKTCVIVKILAHLKQLVPQNIFVPLEAWHQQLSTHECHQYVNSFFFFI